ncbi:uncharacterized protein LOC143199022 isoform X2 [Rhynchophorus ferrugineus]|uniref:uncharacterized protein LOC143199022 isoform X2 n=1 Tax=Rhynchophorus ferrugineus TaxID=354439 RepID=UPI003FCE47FD
MQKLVALILIFAVAAIQANEMLIRPIFTNDEDPSASSNQMFIRPIFHTEAGDGPEAAEETSTDSSNQMYIRPIFHTEAGDGPEAVEESGSSNPIYIRPIFHDDVEGNLPSGQMVIRPIFNNEPAEIENLPATPEIEEDPCNVCFSQMKLLVEALQEAL